MTKFILLSLCLCLSLKAEPLFNSYHDNTELDEFVKTFQSKFLKKEVLGKTHGGNTLYCLKFSSGKEQKPAILILGDTNPSSPVGTEIIVQWLKQISKNEESLKKLLEKNSLYIIPRPFPDSIESFFKKPYRENRLNKTAVDADSDLEVDEDGFEDLNKDGFITLMRIKDENGSFFEHKDSSLLMVKSKNDNSPSYMLISEGIDNDKDEKFNEDPSGGVNPNRNFAFAYPYFQKDAGVHQFSEIESKAIADFAFDHPEIVLVFSFGDEDNLVKPWKEDGQRKKAPVRSTIYKDDEKVFELYSSKFKNCFDTKNIRNSKSRSAGSFAHWAYYHFGRISLTALPWEIPIEEIEGKQAVEIKEVEWLRKNRPQALSEWKIYKHPDFPDKKLEIGGIKPFYQSVPDIKVCMKKAEKLNRFFHSLTETGPKVTVEEFKSDKLSSNLSRITLKIKNTGSVPLRTKIGEQSKKMYPLNLSLELPKDWKLYDGHLKVQIGNLQVNEEKEISWLAVTVNNKGTAKVNISSPQIIDFSATTGENK